MNWQEPKLKTPPKWSTMRTNQEERKKGRSLPRRIILRFKALLLPLIDFYAFFRRDAVFLSSLAPTAVLNI